MQRFGGTGNICGRSVPVDGMSCNSEVHAHAADSFTGAGRIRSGHDSGPDGKERYARQAGAEAEAAQRRTLATWAAFRDLV